MENILNDYRVTYMSLYLIHSLTSFQSINENNDFHNEPLSSCFVGYFQGCLSKKFCITAKASFPRMYKSRGF